MFSSCSRLQYQQSHRQVWYLHKRQSTKHQNICGGSQAEVRAIARTVLADAANQSAAAAAANGGGLQPSLTAGRAGPSVGGAGAGGSFAGSGQAGEAVRLLSCRCCIFPSPAIYGCREPGHHTGEACRCRSVACFKALDSAAAMSGRLSAQLCGIYTSAIEQLP